MSGDGDTLGDHNLLVWIHAADLMDVDKEKGKVFADITGTNVNEWKHYATRAIVGAVVLGPCKSSEYMDSPWSYEGKKAHEVLAHFKLKEYEEIKISLQTTGLLSLPSDSVENLDSKIPIFTKDYWNLAYKVVESRKVLSMEQPYAEFVVNGIKDLVIVDEPLWVREEFTQIRNQAQSRSNRVDRQYLTWYKWLCLRVVWDIFIILGAIGLACYYVETHDVPVLRWIMRLLVLFYTNQLYAGWSSWKNEFNHRAKKSDPNCPSHHRRPDLPSEGSTVVASSQRFGDIPDGARMCPIQPGYMDKRRDSAIHLPSSPRNANRRGTAIGAFIGTGQSKLNKSILSKERAAKLDMDHQWLSLTDIIWTELVMSLQITLSAIIGIRPQTGILGILFSSFWTRIFGRAPFDFPDETYDDDVNRLVFELCVESTVCVWCTGVTKGIARFKVPGTAHVKLDETVECGDLIWTLDLEKGKAIEGSFNGKKLRPCDLLALAVSVGSGNSHTVIHSYANWGTNVGYNVNPFIRRMGVLTIKWNYYGVTTSQTFIDLCRSLGLVKYISSKTSKLSVYMNHQVQRHSHGSRGFKALKKLEPYSQTIKFLFKLRPYFLMRFEYHQADFPDIDGESLFVGTVIHSIDHIQTANLMNRDVLSDFSGRGDPEYKADHEFGALVIGVMSSKPMGYFFESRMSHISKNKRWGHPFYREVYDYAVKINPRLAGYLEAAVCM